MHISRPKLQNAQTMPFANTIMLGIPKQVGNVLKRYARLVHKTEVKPSCPAENFKALYFNKGLVREVKHFQ
jgi:hypothetical protein